jgi:hypothetical protein
MVGRKKDREKFKNAVFGDRLANIYFRGSVWNISSVETENPIAIEMGIGFLSRRLASEYSGYKWL